MCADPSSGGGGNFPSSSRCRQFAAVVACGDDAVLSHGSAAALWGLEGGGGAKASVDVAVRRGYRRRPGIRLHRLPTLARGDWTRIERIPVTTAARTLWDLGGSSARSRLERAIASGIDRGLVRPDQLRALVDRHRGAPGSSRLRSLLDSGAALTRSEAEGRFLDLVRQAQLPEPATNHRVAGLEVDFFWRRARLVVEVNGFSYHGSAAAFESDRQRDGRLVAAGYTVLRVTWRQLTGEPVALVARLSLALGRSARP